jgi:hypothetical protein
VISTKAVMKCFPFSAQRADYVLHPASESIDINVRETVILLQARRSRRTVQVENGVLLAVKHMHVGRLMVIQINHDAGSADAENRWHAVTLSVSCAQVNPNGWVFAGLLFSTAKDGLCRDQASLGRNHSRRYQPNGRGARFIKGHACSVEYFLLGWLRMTATFGQVTSGVSCGPWYGNAATPRCERITDRAAYALCTARPSLPTL